MGLQETLKALADPVRRDILHGLKQERRSAGDIAKQFSLSQATISYHLAQLREAGLVYETREKNYIYYELNTSVFEDVLLLIAQLKGEHHA
jgi:ArsR family transcriptional regulator